MKAKVRFRGSQRRRRGGAVDQRRCIGAEALAVRRRRRRCERRRCIDAAVESVEALYRRGVGGGVGLSLNKVIVEERLKRGGRGEEKREGRGDGRRPHLLRILSLEGFFYLFFCIQRRCSLSSDT
jgi:hypothetical protein